MPDFIPLFVNDSPHNGINSDNQLIAYNATSERVYEIGVPTVSASGDSLFTSFDSATGDRLVSQLFASSMPISSNTAINIGTLFRQIVADANAVYGCTEGGAARGLSRWDSADLIEDAFLTPSTAIGNTNDTPIGTFTLDGVDYVVVTYGVRIWVVAAVAMTTVVNSAWSPTGQIFYLIVGEQPTSTTQAFYTLTQSGTRLRLYRHIFNSGSGTITSSTLIFNWLSTAVDAAWPGGFSSQPIPYLPMFDISDNTIVMVVGSFTGGGGSTTDAYLLKVNPVTGAIIWQVAVPLTYEWSATSSPSIIDGTLRYLPGTDGSFTYPWAAPTATEGPMLVFDTSDGSYTEESYSEFARLSSNAQRAHIYDSANDVFFYYDADGVLGYGNGWIAFMEVVEPPAGGDIGGSGMQIEPIGCIIQAQVHTLETRDLNSILELGPFRFVEQKESDETSMITTLVLGLTETDTGLVVTVDMATEPDGTIDMATLVDVLGDDIYIDMGEGTGNSDDFTCELLGNDDGSTYPGAPIEFKPEVLDVIEDLGSTKQYSPTGYSYIYHRVRLKATEIDEKFAVKFVDISGQLTGRLK